MKTLSEQSKKGTIQKAKEIAEWRKGCVHRLVVILRDTSFSMSEDRAVFASDTISDLVNELSNERLSTFFGCKVAKEGNVPRK